MQQSTMDQLWSTSHVSGGNVAYVEQLYENYLKNPNSVPEQWRDYFDRLPRLMGVDKQDIPHTPIREHFLHLCKQQARVPTTELLASSPASEYDKKQVKVLYLINAYRVRGHQKANLDPLGLMARENVPDLSLSYHELSEADFDTMYQTGSLFIGQEQATLKSIVEALEKTYCSTVGAEYMHIVDTGEKRWIQQRLESVRSHPQYSAEVRQHLLERLTAAEGLEKYLASKYPGTKRFGLEGGESLIPLMDELIQRGGSYGALEIVIGMAHRGRLNMLVNILGKAPSDLFAEFDGKHRFEHSGDVKYHQGFSSNVMTPGGEVHLALAFNPSHLEIVNPVVEGSVRARQDRREDENRDQVVPILIHGDSAFAGQGVVMETFQMSQTRAYRTGGTIHIIVNNQVGFTTSKQDDIRSTEYCTDIAKMVQAPIFHVNADDPEAVLFVTQLAVDYRNEFKRDIVIDLVCYRRHGHNEADEPSGTQPLMYQKIRKHKTTRNIYADRLVDVGLMSKEEADNMVTDFRSMLDNGAHVVKSLVKQPNRSLFVDWSAYLGHTWQSKATTSFDLKKLQKLATDLCHVPDGFILQRQVAKIVDDRRKMALGAIPINWGFAESLAYATLLSENHPVRITGQDVGRGTFSHRHAVFHNQTDGSSYVPMQHLNEDLPPFTIHDSLLSEEAVLAFEYGYATTAPNTLVIWEAQFGDFANGAQVVMDQFISSGEHKWSRLCGLTMFLPHGYEGQGPEHSSARIERYLQLCAEHNIQVCIPSTPAQVFHMLRRQVIRPLRKPLVVMSPKSLLRHKLAVSTLEELSEGTFRTVLPEVDDHIDSKAVDRVVMCSGKVYYELLELRRELDLKNVALIRIEQVYPFPDESLLKVFEQYPNVKDVIWCQEEPKNQGVWFSTRHRFTRVLERLDRPVELHYIGRRASASPAVGLLSIHVEEQRQLVEYALTGPVPIKK